MMPTDRQQERPTEDDIQREKLGPRGVPGELVVVEPTGSETELVVRIGETQMIVETHGRPTLQPGDKVTFSVDPANVHLFDGSSGVRLLS